MAAGSIVIDLLMRTGSFETDSKRAEKRLKELKKEAEQFGKAIGTGVAVGAAALTAITWQAIQFADEIYGMSERLKISTEVLSGWGYAAQQSGTSFESLTNAIPKLSKNLAAAQDEGSRMGQLFDAIGIKVTDAEGKLRRVEDVLPEIADRFKALDNPTTEAALAMELFGRSGAELLEFLNQGSSGIKELTDRAADLGIEISGGTAAAADEFNDKISDMKALVTALGLQVAAELLPQLIELVDKFTNLVKEGDSAAEIAEVIGAGFKVLEGTIRVVSSTVRGITFDLIALGNAGQAAWSGLTGDWEGAARNWKEAALAREMAAAESADIGAVFGLGGSSKPNMPTLADDPTAAMLRPLEDAAKKDKSAQEKLEELLKAFFQGRGTTSKARSERISEEERELERLNDRYESMMAGVNERIALFGQEGEAAAIRYATEHGELVKLTDAQKRDLISRYERLDLMREEEDLAKELAEQDKRRLEDFEGVIGAIREQIDLVVMSAAKQEIYNNLKWAGVDAESAWGKEIIASTEELQRQREAMNDQIEFMDSIRDAGKDLFVDWVGGAKSFKDAALDALDQLHARILNMIAENLMDQLFGKQGDPAGGSTGGWFSSLLGSFFGGGKAAGGDVLDDRAYLVGEHGPEMFIPRTAGTILPAPQTAAAMASGGRGFQQTVVFKTTGRVDRRTKDDVSAAFAREAQVAMRRNGR